MRKPRRRIIIIVILSSVMISLAGLAAYAWMEKRGAETRGRIALLAAQSRSLLESESDLALLLGVEANRLAENMAGSATLGTGLMKKAASALSNENYAAGAAKSSLFAALTLLPQRVRFFRGAGQIMTFSPDGQKFAFLEAKNLVIYDLAGGQQVSQPLLFSGRSFGRSAGRACSSGNTFRGVNYYFTSTVSLISRKVKTILANSVGASNIKLCVPFLNCTSHAPGIAEASVFELSIPTTVSAVPTTSIT